MDFESTVEMPSLGMLDGSRETIQIRSMTVRDEKVLFSKSLTAGEKFLRLVQACTEVTAPMDAKKIPFSDVMYLFIKLRNLSIGTSVYKFRISCNVCENSFFHELDLDAQPIKHLANEEDPYEVSLPRIGKKLMLKHMRLGDQIEMDRMAKTRRNMAQGPVVDSMFVTERLAGLIASIDGNDKVTFSERCNFIDSLTIADKTAIDDSMVAHDFGIDMKTLATCAHCGSSDEYLVRMDPAFFRSPRAPEAA